MSSLASVRAAHAQHAPEEDASVTSTTHHLRSVMNALKERCALTHLGEVARSILTPCGLPSLRYSVLGGSPRWCLRCTRESARPTCAVDIASYRWGL